VHQLPDEAALSRFRGHLEGEVIGFKTALGRSARCVFSTALIGALDNSVWVEPLARASWGAGFFTELITLLYISSAAL
jgi:hypothetical protein